MTTMLPGMSGHRFFMIARLRTVRQHCWWAFVATVLGVRISLAFGQALSAVGNGWCLGRFPVFLVFYNNAVVKDFKNTNLRILLLTCCFGGGMSGRPGAVGVWREGES